MIKTYRVFRGAECPANTDHMLVIAGLAVDPYRGRRRHTIMKKFDVQRLVTNEDATQTYAVAVQNKYDLLGSLPEDPEECWTTVSSVIRSCAEETVGYCRKKRQPWLSDAAFDVLQEKADAKLRDDDAQRRSLQAKFKRLERADKEVFLNRVATEAEENAKAGRIGPVFRAVRIIAGNKVSNSPAPVKKHDGSACKSNEDTLERWREHYDQALNHGPGSDCPELSLAANTASPVSDVRTDEPSLDEVVAAVKKLKNGKAAGSDGIPPELLKCALHPVSHMLHALFLRVWRSGHVPAKWRDGILISLYKGRGPKDECGSYRPISLLSVPGKVFAHLLLERLKPLLQSTQRPQQSGFTAGRSTIDAILALRLLSEIHRHFSRPLYAAYIDIKAAFDSVDRTALWRALRARGVPDILVQLISDLHFHTGSRVRLGELLSERFCTTSGVRQGCVLAPALFAIAIDWILGHLAPHVGITLGRRHFTDLAYADDAVILLDNDTSVVDALEKLCVEASTFGLKLSWPKTKLQNLGVGPPMNSVVIDNTTVEGVEKFTYLGSQQGPDGYCRSDMMRRIGLASAVMGSLQRLWKCSGLSCQTKVHLYQALVMSVLLYSAETWTLTSEDLRKLESFHMRCQRQLLNIHWSDHVTNMSVRESTGLTTINQYLRRQRLSIFGHIARLDPAVPANAALRLAVDTKEGRRPDPSWRRRPGRPRRTWADQVREDAGIPLSTLWSAEVAKGHGAVRRSSTWRQ